MEHDKSKHTSKSRTRDEVNCKTIQRIGPNHIGVRDSITNVNNTCNRKRRIDNYSTSRCNRRTIWANNLYNNPSKSIHNSHIINGHNAIVCSCIGKNNSNNDYDKCSCNTVVKDNPCYYKTSNNTNTIHFNCENNTSNEGVTVSSITNSNESTVNIIAHDFDKVPKCNKEGNSNDLNFQIDNVVQNECLKTIPNDIVTDINHSSVQYNCKYNLRYSNIGSSVIQNNIDLPNGRYSGKFYNARSCRKKNVNIKEDGKEDNHMKKDLNKSIGSEGCPIINTKDNEINFHSDNKSIRSDKYINDDDTIVCASINISDVKQKKCDNDGDTRNNVSSFSSGTNEDITNKCSKDIKDNTKSTISKRIADAQQIGNRNMITRSSTRLKNTGIRDDELRDIYNHKRTTVRGKRRLNKTSKDVLSSDAIFVEEFCNSNVENRFGTTNKQKKLDSFNNNNNSNSCSTYLKIPNGIPCIENVIIDDHETNYKAVCDNALDDSIENIHLKNSPQRNKRNKVRSRTVHSFVHHKVKKKRTDVKCSPPSHSDNLSHNISSQRGKTKDSCDNVVNSDYATDMKNGNRLYCDDKICDKIQQNMCSTVDNKLPVSIQYDMCYAQLPKVNCISKVKTPADIRNNKSQTRRDYSVVKHVDALAEENTKKKARLLKIRCNNSIDLLNTKISNKKVVRSKATSIKNDCKYTRSDFNAQYNILNSYLRKDYNPQFKTQPVKLKPKEINNSDKKDLSNISGCALVLSMKGGNSQNRIDTKNEYCVPASEDCRTVHTNNLIVNNNYHKSKFIMREDKIVNQMIKLDDSGEHNNTDVINFISSNTQDSVYNTKKRSLISKIACSTVNKVNGFKFNEQMTSCQSYKESPRIRSDRLKMKNDANVRNKTRVPHSKNLMNSRDNEKAVFNPKVVKSANKKAPNERKQVILGERKVKKIDLNDNNGVGLCKDVVVADQSCNSKNGDGGNTHTLKVKDNFCRMKSVTSPSKDDSISLAHSKDRKILIRKLSKKQKSVRLNGEYSRISCNEMLIKNKQSENQKSVFMNSKVTSNIETKSVTLGNCFNSTESKPGITVGNCISPVNHYAGIKLNASVYDLEAENDDIKIQNPFELMPDEMESLQCEKYNVKPHVQAEKSKYKEDNRDEKYDKKYVTFDMPFLEDYSNKKLDGDSKLDNEIKIDTKNLQLWNYGTEVQSDFKMPYYDATLKINGVSYLEALHHDFDKKSNLSTSSQMTMLNDSTLDQDIGVFSKQHEAIKNITEFGAMLDESSNEQLNDKALTKENGCLVLSHNVPNLSEVKSKEVSDTESVGTIEEKNDLELNNTLVNGIPDLSKVKLTNLNDAELSTEDHSTLELNNIPSVSLQRYVLFHHNVPDVSKVKLSKLSDTESTATINGYNKLGDISINKQVKLRGLNDVMVGYSVPITDNVVQSCDTVELLQDISASSNLDIAKVNASVFNGGSISELTHPTKEIERNFLLTDKATTKKMGSINSHKSGVDGQSIGTVDNYDVVSSQDHGDLIKTTDNTNNVKVGVDCRLNEKVNNSHIVHLQGCGGTAGLQTVKTDHIEKLCIESNIRNSNLPNVEVKNGSSSSIQINGTNDAVIIQNKSIDSDNNKQNSDSVVFQINNEHQYGIPITKYNYSSTTQCNIVTDSQNRYVTKIQNKAKSGNTRAIPITNSHIERHNKSNHRNCCSQGYHDSARSLNSESRRKRMKQINILKTNAAKKKRKLRKINGFIKNSEINVGSINQPFGLNRIETDNYYIKNSDLNVEDNLVCYNNIRMSNLKLRKSRRFKMNVRNHLHVSYNNMKDDDDDDDDDNDVVQSHSHTYFNNPKVLLKNDAKCAALKDNHLSMNIIPTEIPSLMNDNIVKTQTNMQSKKDPLLLKMPKAVLETKSKKQETYDQSKKTHGISKTPCSLLETNIETSKIGCSKKVGEQSKKVGEQVYETELIPDENIIETLKNQISHPQDNMDNITALVELKLKEGNLTEKEYLDMDNFILGMQRKCTKMPNVPKKRTAQDSSVRIGGTVTPFGLTTIHAVTKDNTPMNVAEILKKVKKRVNGKSVFSLNAVCQKIHDYLVSDYALERFAEPFEHIRRYNRPDVHVDLLYKKNVDAGNKEVASYDESTIKNNKAPDTIIVSEVLDIDPLEELGISSEPVVKRDEVAPYVLEIYDELVNIQEIEDKISRRSCTEDDISELQKSYSVIRGSYEEALHAYCNDENLWLSFLNFCRQVKWFERGSIALEQFRPLISNWPFIFSLSIDWEFNCRKNVQRAKRIALYALQRHPGVPDIYSKAMAVELECVSTKTKQISYNKNGRTIYTTACSESDLKDAISLCDLTLKTATNAKCFVEMLNVTLQYAFTISLQKKLLHDGLSKFKTSEDLWYKVACLELEGYSAYLSDNKVLTHTTFDRIKRCIIVLHYAATTIGSRLSWKYYLDFICDTWISNKPLLNMRCRKFFNKSFRRGFSKDFLEENHYVTWASIVTKRGKRSIKYCSTILQHGSKKLPLSYIIWEHLLKLHLSSGLELDVKITFSEAVHYLQEDSFPLFKLMILFYQSASVFQVQELYRVGSRLKLGYACIVRAMYLEWAQAMKGMDCARQLFRALHKNGLGCAELYTTLIRLEILNAEVSEDYIRQIFDDGCEKYGRQSADLWLNYIDFECRYGNDKSVNEVHDKAISSLDPELLEMFTRRYERFMEHHHMSDM